MKRSRLVAAGAIAAIAATALPLTLPLTASAQRTVDLRWRTRPDNKAEADVYARVSQNVQSKIKGVRLKYEPGGSEGSNYQDQLRTEIAAGTAPDVFWIPAPMWPTSPRRASSATCARWPGAPVATPMPTSTTVRCAR